MKKLPKNVSVLGRKIPVLNLTSQKILSLYQEFNQAPQGLWDSCKRVIVINSDFPIEDQFYTLKHELAHVVMTFTGLDLIIHPDIQEVIVQSMATLMEDMLAQSRLIK